MMQKGKFKMTEVDEEEEDEEDEEEEEDDANTGTHSLLFKQAHPLLTLITPLIPRPWEQLESS